MKIYLCDHVWDEFAEPQSDWHQALRLAFESFVEGQSGNDNPPPDSHPAFIDSESVIFAHTEYGPDWMTKADQENVACHIILVRGSGGVGPLSSAKGNLHGCYWAPHDLQGPTRPSRVCEFIDQVVARASHQVDWALLQPDPVEDLLAARLVMQAKPHMGGSLHGIAIGAIPAPVLDSAEMVLSIESTHTAELQAAIDRFKKEIAPPPTT